MSTASLAALVNDLKSSPKSQRSEHECPQSLCRTLTPRKVPLVERGTIHEKVRRPYIMKHYLDLTHIDNHITCVSTSLFTLHNESLNIYTHLIPGLLIFLYLLFEWIKLGMFVWTDWNEICLEPNAVHSLYGWFVVDDVIYSRWSTRWFILHALILTLFTMCALSSYYHCGRCCDPHLHDYYLSIDWGGVMLLIFWSFLSCIYIGFECHSNTQTSYFVLVFAFIVFVLTPMFFIWPKWTSFKCKAITLAMFGAFGAIVIPFHWLYFLATPGEYDIFLPVSVQFFVIYCIGFVCFIFRLPERIIPGFFDTIGNSHNIWHLCIVTGSWLWWQGLVQVAEHRTEC